MFSRVFILPTLGLLLIGGINCFFKHSSGNQPTEKPIVQNQTGTPKTELKPLPPPPPSKPIEISADTPIETIYQDIIQKISEDNYQSALEESNIIIDKYASVQPYVVEAQTLRLIILMANRVAYLHLADSYQTGWKTVLDMPDKSLTTTERTTRLAKLSSLAITYYKKHKETSVRLLKYYDDFNQIAPALLTERLHIIAQPFRNADIHPVPQLEKVKSGELLTTEQSQMAEVTEMHNCVLMFWTTLSGLKTPAELNQLLTKKLYQIDQKGFYAWLTGGFQYQVKEASEQAFGDRPELREIFLKRSQEASDLLTKLLPPEGVPPKTPAFNAAQFDPQSLLPK